MKHKLVKVLFLLPVIFLSTVASANVSSELEENVTLQQAGVFLVFAEECADNYWMEKADSKAFIKALDGMIKRGISEGRISKQAVNQVISGAETVVASGGFTYEQKQLCEMFTFITRQVVQPKDRY